MSRKAINDYIILLDHLDSSRFVRFDKNKDLNIIVSKFIVTKKYDDSKDVEEINNIIKTIKNFIK
jgi:hypothetical protein